MSSSRSNSCYQFNLWNNICGEYDTTVYCILDFRFFLSYMLKLDIFNPSQTIEGSEGVILENLKYCTEFCINQHLTDCLVSLWRRNNQVILSTRCLRICRSTFIHMPFQKACTLLSLVVMCCLIRIFL